MGCICFDNETLHYSSPGHGDWGIVRIGMLVPESVMLFVSPSACGRHGALGALQHGYKERVYYCYLSQSDIISGYDDEIIRTVEEVLEDIDITPKAFYVFVSCLDDLIGTDNDAVMELLNEKYPDINFRCAHMNPLQLGSKRAPGITIQSNLYGFLEEKRESDRGVNVIGSFENVHEDSELNEWLGQHNAFLRHIGDFESYDDYQNMSRSMANIVVSPVALQAAENMKREYGIPYIFLPPTYDLDEIEDNYKKLSEFLFEGESNDDLDHILNEARKKAEEDIEKALKVVSNFPIVVDASATIQPFGLSNALLNYGFNVVRTGAQECLPFDQGHLEMIEKNFPQVNVYQPLDPSASRREDQLPESLSIGVEGAYLTGSKYVADAFADLQMFGFHGVSRLMELISDGVEKPVDLKEMLDDYGLVV